MTQIINLASRKSKWRGYEYYIDGNVLAYKQVTEEEYKGIIKGSNNATYNVTLNLNHARNTACDCPLAKGRRIICKHIVALYFTLHPDDAVTYKAQVDKEQEEYEQWLETLPDRVESYVLKLSKKELQEDLLYILFNTEDWILDSYVRHHDIDV